MKQKGGWQSDPGGRQSQAGISSTRLLKKAPDAERVGKMISDNSPVFSQVKLTMLCPRQDIVALCLEMSLTSIFGIGCARELITDIG
jgi:hypothetical protein